MEYLVLSFLYLFGCCYRYRDASREVIAVLNEFSPCVEKASIDEAYLDLTEVIEKRSQRVRPNDLQNTFVVGYPDEEGLYLTGLRYQLHIMVT